MPTPAPHMRPQSASPNTPMRHQAPARARSGQAMADQLNEQSLQRARMGENSPSGQPDTTSNLNRMSGQDARDNMNTGRDPLVPFR
jgi:protein CpxP